jgi:hypothetical protein
MAGNVAFLMKGPDYPLQLPRGLFSRVPDIHQNFMLRSQARLLNLQSLIESLPRLSLAMDPAGRQKENV